MRAVRRENLMDVRCFPLLWDMCRTSKTGQHRICSVSQSRSPLWRKMIDLSGRTAIHGAFRAVAGMGWFRVLTVRNRNLIW